MVIVPARGSFPNAAQGLLAAVLVWAVLSFGGCSKRTARAAPPAPQPGIDATAGGPLRPAGPVSEPQNVGTLPQAQPVPREALPPTQGPLASQRESGKDSVPPPPSPRRTPPATPATAAQPSTPTGTDPAPVPQLGQILSPEQRRQYNQRVDQSIRQAERMLEVVRANSARLSDAQHETIKRISAFIKQAQEIREQDVAIARNLAERAQLLAEDLAKNFR